MLLKTTRDSCASNKVPHSKVKQLKRALTRSRRQPSQRRERGRDRATYVCSRGGGVHSSDKCPQVRRYFLATVVARLGASVRRSLGWWAYPTHLGKSGPVIRVHATSTEVTIPRSLGYTQKWHWHVNLSYERLTKLQAWACPILYLSLSPRNAGASSA